MTALLVWVCASIINLKHSMVQATDLPEPTGPRRALTKDLLSFWNNPTVGDCWYCISGRDCNLGIFRVCLSPYHTETARIVVAASLPASASARLGRGLGVGVGRVLLMRNR